MDKKDRMMKSGGVIAVVLLISVLSVSGAASTPQPDDVSSKIFGEIRPESPVTMALEDTETFGVKQIEVGVNSPAQSVKITITKQDGRPGNVESVTAENDRMRVYRYLRIDADNLDDTNVANASITFDVDQSWMEENSINTSRVQLHRYQEGWQPLQTRVVAESESIVTYRAKTPGFSYFVVSGELNASASNDPASPMEGDAGTQAGDANTGQDTASEQHSGNSIEYASLEQLLQAGAGIVLLLIMVGVVYWREEIVWKIHSLPSMSAKHQLESRLNTAVNRMNKDVKKETVRYDREKMMQKVETARQHLENEEYRLAESVITDIEHFIKPGK